MKEKRILRRAGCAVLSLLLSGCVSLAVPVRPGNTLLQSSQIAAGQSNPQSNIVFDGRDMDGGQDAQPMRSALDAQKARSTFSRSADGSNKWESYPVQPQKDMTIMVYMVASDLESEYGCATSDLMEMIGSGLDADNVNLVVYAGGTQAWHLDLDANRNSYLIYENDGTDASLMIYPEEVRDMADQDTFARFLQEVPEKFPADQYGLICWDHGAGPFGYGSDERTDEMLMIEDLDEALASSQFARQKLAFMMFDACLMSSLEVGKVMADYTDLFCASAELLPGNGCDYAFLSTLNQTTDPKEIIRSAIEYTCNFYKEVNTTYADAGMDYLLCSLDLTKIDYLSQAVDNLFSSILDRTEQNPQYSIDVMRAGANSLHYADCEDGIPDLIDLGDFCLKLAPEFSAETDLVLQELNECVTYGRSNMRDSYGMGMYFPLTAPGLYQLKNSGILPARASVDGLEEFVSIYVNNFWNEAMADQGSRRSRSGAVRAQNLTEGKAALDDELAKTTVSASMTILKAVDVGSTEEVIQYVPVMENLPAVIDGKQVSYNPDPEILLISDGSDGGSLDAAHFRYVRPEGTEAMYQSVSAAAISGSEHLPWMEEQPVVITAESLPQSDQVKITSVKTNDGSDEFASGKNEMSMENMGAFMFAYPEAYKIDDFTVPYNEQFSDIVLLVSTSYDNSFTFSSKKISELDQGQYCYQLFVQDAAGNQTVISYGEFEPETGRKPVTLDTDQGTMYFEVNDKDAILVSYAGSDASITVPDTVDGKPVKAIADGAFYQTLITDFDGARTALQEITLPDSIETIGEGAFKDLKALTKINLPASLKTLSHSALQGVSGLQEIALPEKLEVIEPYAFYGTSLKNVTIPASVKEIGAGAFAGNGYLEKIELKGNSGYTIQDGFVLSQDGKTLLFPAQAIGEEITIPTGVEAIASDAFSKSNFNPEKPGLKKVNFPSSLKEIGRYAFAGQNSLDSISLPDGLVSVKPYAFGSLGLYYAKPDLTVHIGADTTEIGYGAFGLFDGFKFEVSKDNPTFAVTEGKLTNPKGDKEIQWYPVSGEEREGTLFES